MKRSPPPLQPSPSTSSSSSSIANDQKPLKQSTKKPRKKTTPDECLHKRKPSTPVSAGRSSIFRGVTRHRWTGRFEAHLWDKSSYNTTQNKKGKQVYLGAYDCEEGAARTYDLAALKYWGPETLLNFPKENYTKEVEEMQSVSKEEYLASLRRRSSGFSRGVSKYRGVAKHHHNGRWEARIGRVFGNKYLYLGTFSSQEEAAKAYDLAAIQYRGRNAVTNFDISNYIPKEEITIAAPPTTSTETIPDVIEPQPNELDQKHVQEKDEAAARLESSELMINGLCGSPVMAMDGAGCDHERQESDPWSFCLDAAGYGDLLISPHMLEENDANLLDLLDQTVFEDDILLMFDYEMKEEKIDEKSPFDSSSPSSSSTVTSELC